MSIQRWTFINGAEPHWLEEHPMGEYVTYADHVAAVAAARVESYADGRVDGMRDVADLCYQRGVKAARDEMAEPLDHLLTFAEGAQSTAYAAGLVKGQRDERERIDSAVMPILATLARHACTADNWEQTDALIRRLVMEIKAAIRARGEKP